MDRMPECGRYLRRLRKFGGGGGTSTVSVNFSVQGGNGTLKAFVDGSEITDGASVQVGKTVTFVSAPDKGFRVKNWTGAGISKIYPDWKRAKLTVSAASTVKVEFHADITASNPYPANQAILYSSTDAATASGGIGKTYSVQLGKQPKDDGYATVGDRDHGSYRIPSIVKTTVNGRTRLIAAYDVRYRGKLQGNGDIGQSGTHGSDITVRYSDDGGATWQDAVNKETDQKPAIDVKNTYGPAGMPTGGATSTVALDADVCDPCLLVAPDGTIWCGMGGGAGVLGNNWSKSNFRMFKSADDGQTWEEDTNPTGSYARNWRPVPDPGSPKANLTCPGHGIVLTKPVPGTASMQTGTMVFPCQNITYSNGVGVYLAHGTGSPSAWAAATASGSTSWEKWNRINTEEGQICQLDDGSIFMAAKCYDDPSRGTRVSRYKNGSWASIPKDKDSFNGGGASQVSVLKVADGDGATKCGVVAVFRSMNQPTTSEGSGRGNLTVGFARDLSALPGTPADQPLDNTERYYVNIRVEGMCYFGYTDMVMINDYTLGVLYENWHRTDNTLDGMRFAAIDVSKVIEKLSVKP